MRAAVFQGPGRLHKIENLAVPSPGPNQVLIKVDRCGVCGSDITMGKARMGPNPMGEDYDAIFAPGAILGHEISGTIVERGAAVTSLSVGDRIAPMAISGCASCAQCCAGTPLWCRNAGMLMGGYGEYALADESFCVRLPPELSIDLGALVEPMATSYHAVNLAGIRPKDRVVVIGAGAIGLGIVHFARLAGAGTIAAVARSARRESLARRLGCDLYLTQKLGLAEELAEHMGGPADIVFEAAGAPGIIGQCIACLRPKGRLVVAGISAEPEVFHSAGILKEVQIQYATAYTNAEFSIVVEALREPDFAAAALVSETVSLDSFPQIFESLCNGAPHVKVMVDPWMQD